MSPIKQMTSFILCFSGFPISAFAEAHATTTHETLTPGAILEQLYWPIVNFTLTLLILRWIYKQFIAKNLILHREQVAAEMAKAKSMVEDAEQLLNTTTRRLKSIHVERTQIIDEQTSSGKQLAESLLLAAQKRAEQIAKDTERQIAEELKRAEQEVRSKIISEAVRDAEQILRAQMNPETDTVFRDSALASLGS